MGEGALEGESKGLLRRRESAMASSAGTPVGGDIEKKDDHKMASTTYTVNEAIDFIGMGPSQIGVGVVIGIGLASEGIEMLLLSFIAPTVRCAWQLENGADGMIAVSVFFGVMLGCPFWGYISDRFGRKKGALYGFLFTAVASLASAASPNLATLCTLRALTGFGMSVLGTTYSYFMEFLPKANRGKITLMYGLWWSVGAMIEVLLAWLVLPSLGWQWLIVFSTLPILLSTALIMTIPDSPVWLASQGEHEQCKQVLQAIAESNGTTLPEGELITSEGLGVKDTDREWSVTLKQLFCGDLGPTTVLLCIALFAISFTYYGAVLLTTEILADDHDACKAMGSDSLSPLTNTGFQYAFASGFAECPVPVAVIFLVEFGRRRVLWICMLLAAIAILPCLLVGNHPHTQIGFLFMARSMTAGAFNTVFVYGNEIFPTNVRTTAFGIVSIFNRLGGMVAPLVAQSVYQTEGPLSSFTVCITVAVLAAVTTFSFPFETAGNDLPLDLKYASGESGNSNEKEALTSNTLKFAS